MKQTTLILIFAVLAWFLPAETCKARHFDAVVTEYGQLASVLGDDWQDIDSLIVHGPINAEDFKTMYNCTTEAVMTSINLADADVEGKKIPDCAFVDWKYQYLENWPNQLYLNLRHVILPDDIEEIGEKAFALVGLETINIPSSLKVLGKDMFYDCHWLSTDIVLPEGITEIPDRCFFCCQSFRNVTLPSTLKVIGYEAFYNTRMFYINFPEGLDAVLEGAFLGSGELKEAILPNSVTYLGEWAFAQTDSLSRMRLPEGITYIPNHFLYLNGLLEELDIPSSVKYIREGAFAISNLKKVTLHEGLKEIGPRGFYGSKLDSITFPSTLEKVYGMSFNNIYALKQVISFAAVPPVFVPFNIFPEYGLFGGGMDTGTPVYVPEGSADLYRDADGWNYYNNYIEMEGSQSDINMILTDREQERLYYGLDGNLCEKKTRGFKVVKSNGKSQKVLIK